MNFQDRQDETQARAMAIAMAIGRGSTIADANDAVATFVAELNKRGYMVVRQDFGKEAFEPDFFYDPDDWETTYTDRSQAVDDLRDSDKLEIGKVAALGRLLALPTVYLVSIPIEDGGREIEEYATRDEAERRAAWVATPRPLLKLDEIRPGDRLRADDAFTCLEEGQVVTVEADAEREGTAALFVPCDDGRHYLDGQEDEDGTCIGFERLPGSHLAAPVTTGETVGSKLLKEIERVAGLRERYKGLRGMAGVNVEPAIAMMTMSIEAAQKALADDDAIASITALRSLEGFTE